MPRRGLRRVGIRIRIDLESENDNTFKISKTGVNCGFKAYTTVSGTDSNGCEVL